MIALSLILMIIASQPAQRGGGESQETGIGERKTSSARQTKQTTVVTSARMDIDNSQHIATFIENVHVKDVDGDMWADKMVVYFNPDKKDLKKLIATGEKVIIVTQGKRSISHKAVYTSHDGKIVLTGDPRITHGRNTYGADRITIFKNQEKTIFEPKARLILYSEEGGAPVEEML